MDRLFRVAAATVALTVGCGGGDPTGTDDDAAGNDGGAAGAVAAGGGGAGGSGGDPACNPAAEYPLGPYGNDVGDVVAELRLQGYRNDAADGLAAAQPVVDYTLNHARLTCKGFALIHLSDAT